MKKIEKPTLPEVKDYFNEPSQKERRKNWNTKVFRPTGNILVDETSYDFYKIITVLFFILVGFFILSLVYLIKEGKMQSIQEVVFNPNFNISTFNQYNNTFNSNIQNDYEFRPENNFTIIVNNIISEP